MKIAQVSTLSSPTRRHGTGSVEGIVWRLSEKLIDLGHEVTIFACGGSTSRAEVRTTLPGPYGEDGSPGDWQLCEWLNLCEAVKSADSERFDVIHCHGYLWGL